MEYVNRFLSLIGINHRNIARRTSYTLEGSGVRLRRISAGSP